VTRIASEQRPVSAEDVGICLGSVAGPAASAELWYARVGSHAAEVEQLSRSLLSDDERARVSRYRSRDAAERYVVTRSLVRSVLGRTLNQRPQRVDVARTDTGKPIVAGGVHFNVSHSGDLIVLALSRGRDVGVDVERRRLVPRVADLSERWLTSAERDDVQRLALAGHEASDAFLRVWTRKEACLKALGIGISGASLAVDTMHVVSLDDVLSPFTDARGGGYVGAIAFA
jgi:4'-phosphopantetheinyl transferase